MMMTRMEVETRTARARSEDEDGDRSSWKEHVPVTIATKGALFGNPSLALVQAHL
jgi:hypothetical protein